GRLPGLAGATALAAVAPRRLLLAPARPAARAVLLAPSLAAALHLAPRAAGAVGGGGGDPLRRRGAAPPRLGGALDLLVLPVALRASKAPLRHSVLLVRRPRAPRPSGRHPMHSLSQAKVGRAR